MKLPLKLFSSLVMTVLSINAYSGIITFNDRTAFENYVATFTVDNLDTSLTGSGLDLSNADYSWSMSDYACTDSTGCVYGSGNPFVNGSNDWVWTYGSGAFTFNSPITAFGLDYVDPYLVSVGRVGLMGFDSGVNPNGSFFGVATDDGSYLGTITYTQYSTYQGFDNIIYSTTPNGGQQAIPAPASLALLGLGLFVMGYARKK